MSDKLTTTNGETVSIDAVLEALEKAPTREEIAEALKTLRQNRVVDALDQTAKAARFDLSGAFDEFLADGEKAPNTVAAYRRGCPKFFSWLNRAGIHVLQARRADVNKFKSYLSGRYSVNTVRLTLAACSAFFSYLEAEQYSERSPFIGIKYPKKVYKKAVKPDQGRPVPVMSEEEYKAIMEALSQKTESGNRLERESAQRMTAAFHFMAMYGLRVGDLLTVRIEDGGRFSYRQKGGEVLQRRLLPETAVLLQSCGMTGRLPFASIAKITVQKAMQRISTALATSGKIQHAYSAHDFRHYFAVKLYRETGDVYAVKQALGHATVSVTEVYLAGLGAIGK